MLGLVPAVVAFAAAVGTLIAWFSSDSFSGAFESVAPYVGAACLVGFGAAGIYALIKDLSDPPEWVTSKIEVAMIRAVPVLVGVTYGVVRALIPWDEQDLRSFAIGTIAFGVIVTPYYGYRFASSYQDLSKRECPDCKETIKAEANVCRYCGHRLHPGPAPAEATLPMTKEERAAAMKETIEKLEELGRQKPFGGW